MLANCVKVRRLVRPRSRSGKFTIEGRATTTGHSVSRRKIRLKPRPKPKRSRSSCQPMTYQRAFRRPKRTQDRMPRNLSGGWPSLLLLQFLGGWPSFLLALLYRWVAPSFAGFAKGGYSTDRTTVTRFLRRPAPKRNSSPTLIHSDRSRFVEEIEAITAPAPVFRG